MTDTFFRFAHPEYLIVGLCGLVIAAAMRLYFRQPVRYTYSLTQYIISMGLGMHPWRTWVVHAIRFLLFLGMLFLLARPQLVDKTKKMEMEGVDIMLVLDISESMLHPDDTETVRRIDSAKQEAIRFINKRPNDAIGLVLFGNEVFVRCPVTYDKTILQGIISDVEVGMIDGRGTVIARALISAMNHLKKSKSKTKIMILLTDGNPQDDLNIELPISIAQHMGIKIYTIGIGLNSALHPLLGLVRCNNVPAIELLKYIAEKTGGEFFLANNSADMRAVYDKIDALERTAHEVPVFSHYTDLYINSLFVLALGIIGELCLTTFMWLGL